MKKHLLFYFFIISFSTFSQQGNFITENEYEYRKSNKLLKGDEIIITEDMINPGSFKNNVNYIKKFNWKKMAVKDTQNLLVTQLLLQL